MVCCPLGRWPMATTKRAHVKPPTAGEERLLDEIRLAAKRVDAEPGGRLAWLVRFVREDPADWLPADREGHGFRLLAIGYGDRIPLNLVGGSGIEPLSPDDVTRLH